MRYIASVRHLLLFNRSSLPHRRSFIIMNSFDEVQAGSAEDRQSTLDLQNLLRNDSL